MDLIQPLLENPTFILGRQLCSLFYVVFSLALVFWTWRDAKKRGAMGWFWAIVVLLFNIFGWAIYMLVRPPEFLADAKERALEIKAKESELKRGDLCPSCMRPVNPDFLMCPHCMKKLKKPCEACDRAIDMHWKVCPYCMARQEAPTPAPAARTKATTTTTRRDSHGRFTGTSGG